MLPSRTAYFLLPGLLALTLAACCDRGRSPEPLAAAPRDSKTPDKADRPEVVYVYGTNTGDCYHLAWCHHLKQSEIKMTLDEAKKKGLVPCEACKPPK